MSATDTPLPAEIPANAVGSKALFSRCGDKATTYVGGPMRVQHPDKPGRALCGQRWHFECNHGETYCQRCQKVLRQIYRRENAKMPLEWTNRSESLPEGNQRVLVFSPCYPVGHEMRFRILSGQFLRLTDDVESWVCCESLRENDQNPSAPI